MIHFLSLADVLHIHRDLIERYGGSHGVRDMGALEAAIHRPQSGYYGDVLAQAAAMWESLSQNHPFIDGNKRVGFAATYAFLRVNGWVITAKPDVTFEFIDGMYVTGRFTASSLQAWLRDNVAPVP